MHYYPFNIKDFSLHTAHLSLLEEAVYRRLLDYYYDSEQPIPKETQPVIRRLRLGSDSDILALILEEFFTLEADGWHNYRADIEIAKYNNNAKAARANGKKGGRPRKNKGQETQPVNLANPEITQPKANQELEPLTKTKNYNQELIKGMGETPKPPKSKSVKLDYSGWPEEPSQQVLDDWLKHRTALKAKVSQTVINRLTGELAKAQSLGLSVDDCLAESMARGWKGFKAEWMENKPKNFYEAKEQRIAQREADANDWVNTPASSDAFGTAGVFGKPVQITNQPAPFLIEGDFKDV